MNYIDTLGKLSIELIQLKNQINELLSRKKELEKKQDAIYKELREALGYTGKTVNDFCQPIIEESEDNV